jgi:hypothetical protein
MKFAEVLQQLESNPICQSLSLHSYLMLPIQRITRLPLLVEAVRNHLDQTDDEYSTCQLALATLNKVSAACSVQCNSSDIWGNLNNPKFCLGRNEEQIEIRGRLVSFGE